MNSSLKKRFLISCSAFVFALATGKAAFADDSEIFLGNSSSGVAPNILFILDTSGSMGSNVTTRDPYDPAVTYGGSCNKDYIYFQTSSSSKIPKGCNDVSSFKATYLNCLSVEGALSSGGNGFYTDEFVQWRSRDSNYFWTNTLSGSSNRYDVACQADFPDTAPTQTRFPTTYNNSKNTAANRWVANPNATNSYWKSGGSGTGYTLFSANYLNYQGSTPTVVVGTRMSVMKQAATDLVNSISNANVGIMRYSNNGGSNDEASAAGGMVAFPVSPIAANRTKLADTIKAFSAEGNTPLSETLYEAYQYMSGGEVYFGDNSKPFKSVDASRVGNTSTSKKYQSPIQYQCQKNFIVYLTDGLPTQDTQASSRIKDLIATLPPDPKTNLQLACDNTDNSPYNGLDSKGNPIPGGWGPSKSAGQCMAALAKYMNVTDLAPKLEGPQNTQLYTIGFGDDPSLSAASDWLAKAASNGGGDFHAASDLDGLQAVFSKIVADIKKTSVTFTAPTVSVNAFNRTQTLNDLYVSLFQPAVQYHWPGNVKKYRVKDGVIVDKGENPAVDDTKGTFKTTSQDLWSESVDGADVLAGGAASRIPDWKVGARNVYTYVGPNLPTEPADLSSDDAYSVENGNTLITNAMLGVSQMQRENVMAYARGEDLRDEFGDNDKFDEQRHAMGDPLHSQPAVVIYGGTPSAQNSDDAVIFSATNDGYLHAFRVTDGVELWAYIPQELLPDLSPMYSNSPTSPKNYALDGNIKALKFDVNGDGVVDEAAGDRVILFFGQGRGGSNYYAIDVSNKTKPKFMWSIGPDTPGMAGIGQAWSTPVFTKVSVTGASQNTQKLVLVIGGGYDSSEESTTYQASNATGNAIYMVDALKGTVLWSASKTGASLDLPRMDHSIPSDVTVLDLDGDGFADRMYVGDMAGQLWRFDVFLNQAPAKLVTGGVIASLGTHDDATHTIETTRRFYNAPDVAAITKKGVAPFFNIAIGSGYRGHPLDTQVHDRFYAIRDYQLFEKLTQDQYEDVARPIIQDSATKTDSLLIDVTTDVTKEVPANALGWFLSLNQPGNSWIGEKVLSSASTFNNQILFTSYIPNTTASADPCLPGLGTNRLYAVSAFDGDPVADFVSTDTDSTAGKENTTTSDRFTKLNQTGIAPQVTFLFPEKEKGGSDDGGEDGGDDDGDPETPPPPPPPPPKNQPVVCMSGAEVLGVCRDFNSRLKTYWSESNAQ